MLALSTCARLSALFTAFVLASPALAFVPATGHAVCPLDGKGFDYPSFAAYSTYGRRLDGKPVGSAEFPLPVPECPGSLFPVYRDFKAGELDKLRSIAASTDYQPLKSETSSYRMHGVMVALGEPVEALTNAALVATWQVEGVPDRYSRYAAVFLREADAMISNLGGPSSEKSRYIQLIAADVQRQAGDFDGASKRLAVLRSNNPLADWSVAIGHEARLIEANELRSYTPATRIMPEHYGPP